jgi:hypothetical protein
LRSSHVYGRGLAASLIAFGVGLAVTPTASAEPNDAVQSDSASAAQVPASAADPMLISAPNSDDANPAAVTACSQFADALDTASTYYGTFADAIERTDQPDYADPYVSTSNMTGRTALREAAAAAMSAAGTPGLQSEVADPMRAWSLGATKLLVKMALHGGGDSLNGTANQLNTDANNTQVACAAAGTHA